MSLEFKNVYLNLRGGVSFQKMKITREGGKAKSRQVDGLGGVINLKKICEQSLITELVR